MATDADHVELVEAIADGDGKRARRILVRHLKALREELGLDGSAAGDSLKQILKA